MGYWAGCKEAELESKSTFCFQRLKKNRLVFLLGDGLSLALEIFSLGWCLLALDGPSSFFFAFIKKYFLTGDRSSLPISPCFHFADNVNVVFFLQVAELGDNDPEDDHDQLDGHGEAALLRKPGLGIQINKQTCLSRQKLSFQFARMILTLSTSLLMTMMMIVITAIVNEAQLTSSNRSISSPMVWKHKDVRYFQISRFALIYFCKRTLNILSAPSCPSSGTPKMDFSCEVMTWKAAPQV